MNVVTTVLHFISSHMPWIVINDVFEFSQVIPSLAIPYQAHHADAEQPVFRTENIHCH